MLDCLLGPVNVSFYTFDDRQAHQDITTTPSDDMAREVFFASADPVHDEETDIRFEGPYAVAYNFIANNLMSAPMNNNVIATLVFILLHFDEIKDESSVETVRLRVTEQSTINIDSDDMDQNTYTPSEEVGRNFYLAADNRELLALFL